MLDELLKYHETPEPDDFTLQVMQAVRRRQRLRKMILWGAGGVGALFGIAGFSMLAEPMAALFAGHAVPVSLGLVLTAGAAAWLLQDETVSTG